MIKPTLFLRYQVMLMLITNLGEPSLKKNGKIWEKFPKGEGLKKTDENSQFQFGNLKNLGGVSIFQKCLNFSYLKV